MLTCRNSPTRSENSWKAKGTNAKRKSKKPPKTPTYNSSQKSGPKSKKTKIWNKKWARESSSSKTPTTSWLKTRTLANRLWAKGAWFPTTGKEWTNTNWKKSEPNRLARLKRSRYKESCRCWRSKDMQSNWSNTGEILSRLRMSSRGDRGLWMRTTGTI